MIEKDIILALEDLSKRPNFGCSDKFYEYSRNTHQNALDLINLKNAEIERLKHLKCLYSSDGIELKDCIMGDCFYRTTEWEVKSEAIKEFAERLKIKSHISLNKCGDMIPLIYFEDIDNLIKEMEMTEQTTFEKIEHNSLCETETYKGGD